MVTVASCERKDASVRSISGSRGVGAGAGVAKGAAGEAEAARGDRKLCSVAWFGAIWLVVEGVGVVVGLRMRDFA